jgi:hypothetical protein
MPNSPPRRRFTLADVMILVASVAGLFGVIQACATMGWMEPMQAGIQAAITSAALFISLGGLGACVARWRGRPRFEGFCLAFICGPFGMAMIALMPDTSPEDPGDPGASLTAPPGRGR